MHLLAAGWARVDFCAFKASYSCTAAGPVAPVAGAGAASLAGI